MRPSPQPPAAGNLGSRLDGWLLRILTQPPPSAGAGLLIVAGGIAVIGLVDYVTGTTVSLQVFYLLPIALALAWFGFFASFLAAVCSIIVRVGGDYVLGAEYTRRPAILWNLLGILGIYLIFARVLQSFITLRRELEARISARTAELAREVAAREQLQQELIEISERERRSIGNDLHDGLGQHLTAMAFATEVLAQQLARNDALAAGTAKELGRLAEEGVQQSRRLARGLLLTAMEPENLGRELEELATTVQRQTGVQCRYESRSAPLVGDSTTASHIFRIAQEGLRNAFRQDAPTAIQLGLHGEEQFLVLTISDNGTAPAVPTDGDAARREMEHRARLIRAQLTVESTPGQGTRLYCRVPLDDQAFAS